MEHNLDLSRLERHSLAFSDGRRHYSHDCIVVIKLLYSGETYIIVDAWSFKNKHFVVYNNPTFVGDEEDNIYEFDAVADYQLLPKF